MEDELAKLKMGRAYCLPLPVSYMTACGAVSAQWGLFEMQFVGFIRILSRSPDAAEVGSKIPGSFNDKAKLLRRLARLTFHHCPTLADKICDFSTRANQTCKKRNALLHGFWFDMSHFQPEKGVMLVTEADSSGDIYSVTLEQIEALSVKIADLKMEGISLTFDLGSPSERLTPDERSALQEYHKNFPAPHQASPIPRDPNRKGSPTHPEPFQA